MSTTLNKIITSELAISLKENGMRLNFCRDIYYRNPDNNEFIFMEMTHDWILIDNRPFYSAPTIGVVIDYIYENFDVWISVKKDYDNGVLLGFEFILEYEDGFETCGTHSTPFEAYEAGIKHYIKKLKNEI